MKASNYVGFVNNTSSRIINWVKVIMDKIDIFNEDLLDIPLSYDASQSFKKSTIKWIRDYIELLKKFEFDSSIINQVTDFCNIYEELIGLYYQGLHTKAYEEFKKAILCLLSDTDLLIQKVEEQGFYRARIVPDFQKDICYKEDEMWHIPFNKRGLVQTERYSFPGLPCLYLSASSYACWIEMNRPQFNTMQVAYIKPEPKVFDKNFLDISMIPRRFLELYKECKCKYSIDEYALICPLVVLCMVKVNNRKDWFKPEYIFPQFFMEYVIEERSAKNVIGIKYASTKMPSKKQYQEDWEFYTCYAVPTSSKLDEKNDSDNCKTLFSISASISAIEQELLSYGLTNSNTGTIVDAMKKYEKRYIITESEMYISYDSTRFFEIEFCLKIKTNEL